MVMTFAITRKANASEGVFASIIYLPPTFDQAKGMSPPKLSESSLS